MTIKNYSKISFWIVKTNYKCNTVSTWMHSLDALPSSSLNWSSAATFSPVFQFCNILLEAPAVGTAFACPAQYLLYFVQ